MEDEDECIGPCLRYCYNKNSIILFVIGILIGLIIYDYFIKIQDTKEDKYKII